MFDKFFNRFFGKKKEEPKQEPKQETPKRNPISDDLDFLRQSIMSKESPSDRERDLENLLKALSTIKSLGDNPTEDIDDALGKPDRIDYHEEDGLYFKKSVWNVSGGEMVKMVISDIPFNKDGSQEVKVEKSLKERLEDALKKEDYETAASLRDELNKTEK